MTSSALMLYCVVKKENFFCKSLSKTWRAALPTSIQCSPGSPNSLRKKNNKSHVNLKENNLSLFADNMVSYWKKSEAPPKNKQE